MAARTLRVYAVADVHAWDSFHMPELSPDDYDVVLTLGDIQEETLDRIWWMGRGIPHQYGVPGNHDPEDPAGLDNLHCRVVTVQGFRIGGFGGSLKYKEHPNHYTEREVAKRMKKMPPVDIFISHAPPRATSLKEDRIHRGFEAFDDYIVRCAPRYWLHGHLDEDYTAQVGATTVRGVFHARPLVLSFEDTYGLKSATPPSGRLGGVRSWFSQQLSHSLLRQ